MSASETTDQRKSEKPRPHRACMDDNARAIVHYWMDVETLSCPAVPEDSRAPRKRTWHLEWPRERNSEGPLDWTMGVAEGAPETVSNLVYLGLFSETEAIAGIAKILEVDDDPRFDVPSRRLCYLACFSVDRAGRPSPRSLDVSPFALRYETLARGVEPDFEAMAERRDDLCSAFDAWIAEDGIRPGSMTRASLRAARSWLIEQLRATPKQHLRKLVAVTHARLEPSDEPPLPQPGSWVLPDLQNVHRALAQGEAISPPLSSYLMAENFCEADRRDADNKEVIRDLLAPRRLPLGKWPSRGPGGTALAFRQQMAVNASTAMRAGGMFSVNGPPGTGKTTLLRDVIADAIVNRAQFLAELASPDEAFGPAVSVEGGRIKAVIHPLKEDLRAAGILVASSNNTAVENITASLKEISEVYRADEALLGRAGFGRAVAEKLLGEAKARPWAMLSASLGNRNNVSSFLKHYWTSCDQEPRTNVVLPETTTISKSRKGNDMETAEARQDDASIRLIAMNRMLGKLALLARSARGRPVTVWGKRGEDNVFFVNETQVGGVLGELMSSGQPGWQEARLNFLAALADSRSLLDATAVIAEGDATLARCRDQARAAKASIEAATCDVKSIREKLAELVRCKSDKQAEAALRLGTFEQHRLQRPSMLAALFAREARTQWRRRAKELSIALDRIHSDINGIVTNEEAARGELARAVIAEAAAEAAEVLAEQGRTEAESAIGAARSRFQTPLLEFAEFWSFPPDQREMALPWVTEELDLARERVFFAAMALHGAFLRASRDKILGNLRVFCEALDGDRDAMIVRSRSGADLWGTFFLTVPVVSSTFASVARMFGDALPESTIGLLLIDEAGQASPQQAVGALMRARRALVVGDPKQVEPVITTPIGVSRILREVHGVKNADFDVRMASAQTLADRRNMIGAMLGEAHQKVWVGSPLRVHRRCSDPMFSISNAISYGRTMVQGKAPPDPSRWSGEIPRWGPGGHPSAWFDIAPGPDREGHWCETHGRLVADMLLAMVEDKRKAESQRDEKGRPLRDLFLVGGMPNAFVISPFRGVVNALRELLLRDEYVGRFGRADPAITRDVLTEFAGTTRKPAKVGTVHAVQGKEAPTVMLLLGGNVGSSGAVKWAGSAPNLLNVAATRAQSRLYVVGPHAMWTTQRSFAVAAPGGEEESDKTLPVRAIPDFVARIQDPERLRRIDTLEGHLALLSRCLVTAERAVAICSPYLAIRALKHSNCDVPRLVGEAVARNVRVTIYTDASQDTKGASNSAAAIISLRQSGAEVVTLRNVHSKIVCVDNREICEGSFNWLSASRDPSSKYARYESTFHYSGEIAPRLVAEALYALDALRTGLSGRETIPTAPARAPDASKAAELP